MFLQHCSGHKPPWPGGDGGGGVGGVEGGVEEGGGVGVGGGGGDGGGRVGGPEQQQNVVRQLEKS